MRIVIESEDRTSEICTWLLPENAAKAIAGLPDEKTRDLAVSQLTTLLKSHLELMTIALRSEEMFDSFKLIAVSMDQLTDAVHMMT